MNASTPGIVLIHGGFADGSGWEGVYDSLKKDGYEAPMIPPPARRQMSQRAGSVVTEVPGSHAVYVSRPDAVANVIRQAAATLAR